MEKRLFSSKAQTLAILQEHKELNIPKLLIFTIEQWNKNKTTVLSEIKEFAQNSKLVVRSSNSSEDGEQASHAGAYTSVLDVEAEDNALLSAIETVINSYCTAQNNDEFFVQEMINGIVVSGVIMTRVLSDGAPYYVLNYDDESGEADSITGGSRTGKTVFVYHDCNKNNFDSQQLYSYVNLAKYVEKVCGRNELDMEFCLDKEGVLHLLQVRPMCVQKKWVNNIDNLVQGNIHFVVEFLKDRFAPWPDLFGNTTILGVMPDWNPAEMIGFTPPMLSSSFYRELITRSVWRLARAHMGYKKLPSEELMLLLAGRPYIDVRVSFNSFLPNDLDDITSEVLVCAWIERLDKNPQLHDKIEFDIAQTTLDFCFDINIDNRYPGLLTKPRRDNFKNSLRNLTQHCLDMGPTGSVQWAMNAVTELHNRQVRRRNVNFTKGLSTQHILSVFANLLEECCLYGTLPFSVLARHAFIATAILKSAISRNAFLPERLSSFMQSVRTISGEMTEDFLSVSCQNMSKEAFLSKYGHLRPSSYDILSPRYVDRTDLFDDTNVFRNSSEQKCFEFTTHERRNLDILFKESGLQCNTESFEHYARAVIAGREYAKFIFTRDLSYMLELVAYFGQSIGLSREEVSFLDVRDILDGGARALLCDNHSYFFELVEKGRNLFKIGRGLKLGYLLRSPRDVFIVPQHRSAPNFVGNGKVKANVSKLNSSSPCSTPISGCIVCIENADPGYDWIFTRNIAGLITKFGGANSHMSIRCAEYGLPAAIGVGDRLFEKIAEAQQCLLDAGGMELHPIGKM